MDRLIKACRERSSGNDTGGYLAIFDIFLDALVLMREKRVDQEVRPAMIALKKKCDLLHDAAKMNAGKVRLWSR